MVRQRRQSPNSMQLAVRSRRRTAVAAVDQDLIAGHDRMADPPDGLILRRYTNVWQHEGGRWRSIARHAHVVSREAAG